MIGAGTAGGVIAKELTDDKCTSVLVLEAGTNMTNQLSNPSVVNALTLATDNKFSFNILSKIEQVIERQLRFPDGNPSMPAQIIALNAVRFIQEDFCPYSMDDSDLEC